MASDTPPQSACGCGADAIAPRAYGNRPGLSALDFRIDMYGGFLNRMRRQAPHQTVPADQAAGPRPLSRLTLDGTGAGDASTALFDAAAVALDVLTFYQERIANEGFLRTATERQSLLELARTIGYELNPGVAAGVYLGFTVEDAPGAPADAAIAHGTRVQSVPGQGQLPQTFETDAAFRARGDWNALRPLRTYPQIVTLTTETLFLAGTGTRLSVGDTLLIAVPGATPGSEPDTKPVTIRTVTEEPENKWTRVELGESPAPPAEFVPVKFPLASIVLSFVPFTGVAVNTAIFGQRWSERSLGTFLDIQRWSIPQMTASVNHQIAQAEQPAPPLPDAPIGVFAFRARAGIFGHHAPRWNTLPASQRFGEWVDLKSSTSPPTRVPVFKEPVYARDWDANPPPVTKGSDGELNVVGGDLFYLERSIPGLRSNDWIVLTSGTAGTEAKAYRIAAVAERSAADFALTAKATAIQVSDKTDLETFTMRDTTAQIQSEPLALAALPLTAPLKVGDTSLILDRLVLGLSPDQALLLSGERADLPGVVDNEVVVLEDIVHDGGYTVLTFRDPLTRSYVRSSAALNANAVFATHGETVHEVLGSGDGAVANQTFSLRRPPLTYLSSDAPSGARSTLEVRVGGILWDEVKDLYGSAPDDRHYIVRRTDAGATAITGGDGRAGARFPTGTENVTATYRTGIGLGGQVAAGALSLLQTRPPGIRSVANPLPAAGAADPESRDDARVNAPLTVRTLERVVSLRDYEDLARAFAGTGKVQAVALRKGATRRVHVTVAGADGSVLAAGSPVLRNLVSALRQFGDPWQRFQVDGFEPRFFRTVARLRLDTPRYIAGDVLEAAKAAVADAYSFARRGFGQPVTRSELTAVLQNVPGVVAVDIDALHLLAGDSAAESLEEFLPSENARWKEPRPERRDHTILRAELLLISPLGIELTERTGAAQ